MARIVPGSLRVEIQSAGEGIAVGSPGVLQLGMLEVLTEHEGALDGERIRDGLRATFTFGSPVEGRGASSQLRVWPDASEISRRDIVLRPCVINAIVPDIPLRLR